MALRKKVDYMKLQFEKCMQARCFKEPLELVNEHYLNIDRYVKSMTDNVSNKLIIAKKDFSGAVTKLDALSPLKTLARGYSIAKKGESIVKSVKDLKTGDKIAIRFSDGETEATIVRTIISILRCQVADKQSSTCRKHAYGCLPCFPSNILILVQTCNIIERKENIHEI